MARTATIQNSEEASARPRRVPVNSRNRLSVKNKDDGYFYRIVNDVDDRVERLQEAGYEICTKESVGVIGNKRVDGAVDPGSVARFSVGQGVKAVVMRQRKDWYQEDQAAKQAEINALEDTMKRDAKNKSDYGTFDVDR